LESHSRHHMTLVAIPAVLLFIVAGPSGGAAKG
jgi:hypothetical protein